MLDWDRFRSLAGADTENFEKLCRGIVRRQYGSLGPLHQLKNQPGVEFYLTLNDDHPRLGKKAETVGWQNKWFTYKTNNELTSSAKAQIRHSLDKTKKHESHINHWFLWTHKTLAKCDQAWFYDLQENYEFTFYLWNEDDLEDLLSGPALDLRNSYFGELALTPEMLHAQHEKSIAPIKSRWLHDVHQQMDAEILVRKILGEKNAWTSFKNIAENLNEASESIDSCILKPEYSRWKNELELFTASCRTLIEYCGLFNEDISGEDIEAVQTTLAEVDARSKYETYKTQMQLHANNLPLSLTITNALAYTRDAKSLFESALELLSQQFVAILADAGGGKTQLAAELTAQTQSRPAGILILGRSLKTNMGLDDISRGFAFYQKQVNNFEALLAALNSVGERSHRRLPIVIDGINEAQDPREWKFLLASILPVLKKYPNVVLICTLRTSEKSHRNYNGSNKSFQNANRENIAQCSLPESAFEIRSEGYHEELTRHAIKSYFEHYKLKADLFSAPLNFFSHPLNLKIFCDVTNRKAEQETHVSYFPSSIYSLFREQIKHTVSSIVSMTNLKYKYRSEDVLKAIYLLGECIWQEGTRTIKEDIFKNKINLHQDDWDSDIVNLLAQEGVIFRDEGNETFSYELTPVYDLLGGFIVAEYLLARQTNRSFEELVSETSFLDKLFGEISGQHQLSQDILQSLTVLTPKTLNNQQFWKAIPEGFQSEVLAMSYLIDKDDFCPETLDRYRLQLTKGGLSQRNIEQLLTLKYSAHHPLNARFLSEILLHQSVADRDLSWSEHIRSQSAAVINGLKKHLESTKSGTAMDVELLRLRIIFCSWHLTSTVIELRDCATELLYHLGRQDPESIFNLVIELINVNDPYVSERLLAASYAITTVLIDSTNHREVILSFARKLYSEMFNVGAPSATTHLLAREYASCVLKLVAFHHSEGILDLDPSSFSHPFPEMNKRLSRVPEKEKLEYSRSNSPLRMDFENYTIGRLIKNRSNYDFSHKEYREARSTIVCRINDLGWTHERFESTERMIESDRYNHSRSSRSSVERYGKKYSWIAYYELAGLFSDQNKLDLSEGERFSSDIDPFFPDQAAQSKLDSHEFLASDSIATKDWILDQNLPNLAEILEINKNGNNWILLDGFFSESSKSLDRDFFCAIGTVFICSPDLDILLGYMSDEKKVSWPEKYNSYNLYSGEMYCTDLNHIYGESSIVIETGYKTEQYEIEESKIGGKVRTLERRAPIVNEIEVHSTVVTYSWENLGGANESTKRLALAPWIMNKLNMRFNPSTFAYSDHNGERAVLNVYSKGDAPDNYRELIYLRKDLFELLEEKIGMTFVKHLLGEKRKLEFRDIEEDDLHLRFEAIGSGNDTRTFQLLKKH